LRCKKQLKRQPQLPFRVQQSLGFNVVKSAVHTNSAG